ncbi:hypothetical protein Q5P01_025816 [Channa striata]|uniref:Pyrin domain-containing protein n=1 Tax=Channa striata TaxID=64152 RepID=A0AA88IPA5_CHASR|nr:hypothetical protein Q5P01_025816 [Channa striata]
MKPEELLKVLENLEEDNFRKFKWHLEVGKIPKGHKGIPKSKLENAEMQVVVDLMVQKYATGELVEVTKKILEKIPRMDLVECLCESSSEEKGHTSGRDLQMRSRPAESSPTSRHHEASTSCAPSQSSAGSLPHLWRLC